jgi:hypothetical protein
MIQSVYSIVCLWVERTQDNFEHLGRVFKNRLKYDLKSNQIICPEYDLKSQSNRHFPKRFEIKIKSNRFTQLLIILVFLVRLSTCIIIRKLFQFFF